MGKSTRKNPDKLIEQLKRRLRRVERWHDVSQKLIFQERAEHAKEVGRLKGESWFLCDNRVMLPNLTDRTAKKANINQEVIVRGRIVGYKQGDVEENPNQITISLTDVALKED